MRVLASYIQRNNEIEGGERMDYILGDIDIELWSKFKAKATLKRFRLVIMC